LPSVPMERTDVTMNDALAGEVIIPKRMAAANADLDLMSLLL